MACRDCARSQLAWQTQLARCGLIAPFFFFKQKTAYEMVMSDWSSDVCSSDLVPVATHNQRGLGTLRIGCTEACEDEIGRASCRERVFHHRVDLGGRRIIKKKKKKKVNKRAVSGLEVGRVVI